MTAALVGLGAIVEASAWFLVATRRLRVWTALGIGLGGLGVVALAVGPVELSPRLSPGVAAAAGLGAGAVLYLATRAFVFVVRPWRTFERHARSIYGERSELPLWVVLVLAVGVAAVGEELFWRGVAQARLTAAIGRTAGAATGWVAFVAANVPSANLAIVAGAIVGGGVWVSLALWTHGVLASLLCHGMWTTLMIALPVVTVGEPS